MLSKCFNILDFPDERTEITHTLQPSSTSSKPKIIFRAWSHPPVYPDHPSSLAYTDPLPSLDDFGVDDGLKTGDQAYGQDVDLFSDDVIVGTPPTVSGCSALEVGNCQTHLVFITIRTVEVIKLNICSSDDPLFFIPFPFLLFMILQLTFFRKS